METRAFKRRDEDRDGWAVMDAGVKQAIKLFGTRLEAAFAMGSLAHGGFAPAASDVDLALILSDLRRKDVALVQEIGAVVKEEIKSSLAQRLSVFWSTWSSLQIGEGQGRFPLADRQDLVLSGIRLFGADRRSTISLPSGSALSAALLFGSAATGGRGSG